MSKILEKKCKEELKNVDFNHKKLLLHSCCAPCSSHVITYLSKYFDITILYYNPNIAPEEEYLKRKNEQIKLIVMLDTPNKLDFIDCDYDNDKYNELVKGYELCPEKGERCTICFNLRIEKTAKIAKDNNTKEKMYKRQMYKRNQKPKEKTKRNNKTAGSLLKLPAEIR